MDSINVSINQLEKTLAELKINSHKAYTLYSEREDMTTFENYTTFLKAYHRVAEMISELKKTQKYLQ